MTTSGISFEPKFSLIEAGQLHSGHIGTQIRFRVWDNNTSVAVVVTAELRQIAHNSAETTVFYGDGAAKEQVLDGEQPISLKPPADYSDVQLLSEYDERV